MSELLKFLSTAFAHPLNNSRKDNDLQIYHVWLSNAKRYQRFTEPHTLKGIRDSPFFQVKHLSTRIHTKFINITSSLKFPQSIPLNFTLTSTNLVGVKVVICVPLSSVLPSSSIIFSRSPSSLS